MGKHERQRMGYTVVNRRWLWDDCAVCPLRAPQPQPTAQRGAQLSWRTARHWADHPWVAKPGAS